jgi:hypothetical protein
MAGAEVPPTLTSSAPGCAPSRAWFWAGSLPLAAGVESSTSACPMSSGATASLDLTSCLPLQLPWFWRPRQLGWQENQRGTDVLSPRNQHSTETWYRPDPKSWWPGAGPPSPRPPSAHT